MRTLFVCLGVWLSVSALGPSSVRAQSSVPTAGPNELVILNAVANTASETILINGVNFGTATPTVRSAARRSRSRAPRERGRALEFKRR